MVGCPNGEGAGCNPAYPDSTPGPASNAIRCGIRQGDPGHGNDDLTRRRGESVDDSELAGSGVSPTAMSSSELAYSVDAILTSGGFIDA